MESVYFVYIMIYFLLCIKEIKTFIKKKELTCKVFKFCISTKFK